MSVQLNMPYDRIKFLLHEYFQDTITEHEMHELKECFQKEENSVFFKDLIGRALQKQSSGDFETILNGDQLFKNIMEKANSGNNSFQTAKVRRMHWIRNIAVAASITLFIGMFWMMKENGKSGNISFKKHETGKSLADYVLPGSNKARLILADGKVVMLDSNSLGNVSSQGASAVSNKDGELIYHLSKGKAGAEVMINTLSVPKSGQYKLQLADGTTIWMNSASTLRYPVSFPGTVREVELSGEAYFEVAPDRQKPFIVKLRNDARVQVLGTSFNINAYENESELLTTLLEGKVKVSAGNVQVDLIAGQQSRLDGAGNLRIIEKVHTDEVIAWKNGQFIFKRTDLKTLLRQLERWYDIEVEYKGNYFGDRFSGTVPRTSNLSQVLKILELSEVHFQMEKKKLIVMPAFNN